jgi:hypothetical protein
MGSALWPHGAHGALQHEWERSELCGTRAESAPKGQKRAVLTHLSLGSGNSRPRTAYTPGTEMGLF